jgi:PAS domain-containing protein
MSLRFRIAGTIFVLGTLLVAVVLWVTLGHSMRAIRAQVAATQNVTIQLLSDLSRPALLTEDYAELQSFIANAEHDPRIGAVILADTRGNVVASTEDGMVGKRLGLLPEEMHHYWRRHEVKGHTNWLGTLAIQFSDVPLIAAYNAAWRLGLSVAIAGMAGLALVGLAIGYVLTGHLRALAGAADAVTAGAAPMQLRIDGNDEVARVARAFAAMVDRLRAHAQALAQAHARLLEPTQAMSQGFAVWDSDNRLVLFNKPLRELLPDVEPWIEEGAELPALAAALEERVLADAPQGELGRVWLEARQSEETLFEMRLRDGRHIELREARTKDGGTVGIYTDVTREREHERALARNEQRLRHIMASVFDGVITVDSSGAIESVNAAGERIFGWRAEGLVGEPIGRLLAPRGTASRERRQKALQFPASRRCKPTRSTSSAAAARTARSSRSSSRPHRSTPSSRPPSSAPSATSPNARRARPGSSTMPPTTT